MNGLYRSNVSALKVPRKLLGVKIVQACGPPTNQKPPRRFGEQGDEPSSCKLILVMSGVKGEGIKKVIAYH